MKAAIVLLSVASVVYSAAPTCGKTPVPPNLKQVQAGVSNDIVGGKVAVAYSWPWQIVWCSTGWSGGCSLECGGTVIANGWVMTAGHCVYDDMTPGNYMVKAGVFKETSSKEDGEQVVKVKSIHLHPQYDPNVPAHDISLIQLASPLTYTDHVQPICLPKDDTAAIKPGNLAWCTGWGTTKEDGQISVKLRQVDVPFVDFKLCEKEYPNTIQEDVMVCAGKKGLDSCQGDSGGPLVVQGASGAWFQVGIVSFGEGCAEDKEPGIYSRVQAYCDFITKTTGGKAACQAIA